MTTETDWTRFPMTGGTIHDTTDPQCRPRPYGGPRNSEAICVACARGNTEHRAHDRMPCRHWEQEWACNGSVNDHPSYRVTCTVCDRAVTIVLWEPSRAQ